ncbi:Flp pilus assembly protein CpaB [Lichenicola cladoniae]|uniref:Flp pilus assembly protein CpaB n=1 Tax=Lichenicola cladoniae TaxID=1484109 RepID=A0A6M8HI06_9PROT|nr:Flp pilus assembly protein CpaB [Lichenicola cladoniae]NPD69202.1 Flp pilus assembly protein CpaB [Acetobacteraceae bacterium]QKE89029.1 Flp pilus assembly protein CpaB [Lichenicola cladoniae]
MILRLFLFGLMGIGLAGFGTFGWRAIHPPASLPQAALATPKVTPVMLKLLIAAHDLVAGSFLRPEDLSSASVAEDAAPPNARRDTPAARAQLLGALIRRPIPHEAVLDPDDLLLSGEHGFLAAILTPGMRAFTISHDQIVSDAGLIWPGDRLDLILTQQMPGTVPLDRQVSAETVLVDLRVLAIDRQLVQPQTTDDKRSGSNDAPPSASVTVEVSPADAERLAVALRLGKVAFAIRSAIPGMADKAPNQPPLTIPTPGSTTWAGAVMHSLDGLQPPPAVSVHVFEGNADKEYKF